jgi:hypothetical protein
VANYCAIHSRCVTIQPKDMRLVDTLRQLMGGVCFNQAAFLAPSHDRAIPAARETEKGMEMGPEKGPENGPEKGKVGGKKGGKGKKAKAG